VSFRKADKNPLFLRSGEGSGDIFIYLFEAHLL